MIKTVYDKLYSNNTANDTLTNIKSNRFHLKNVLAHRKIILFALLFFTFMKLFEKKRFKKVFWYCLQFAKDFKLKIQKYIH